MSSIYIQEPPTSGKVLLHTSFGDVDIELWCKETPMACRNFIQLCMEGYYDSTIFHRIEKGFVIQGGDPTGTGEGGESIYGENFRNESHQRLKFNRRGLVGTANTGKDDNNSQFFITLDKTDDLNKKHTLFGKITGNTLFNVLSLGDLPVDARFRPENPPKILSAEILSSPFDDIVPRMSQKMRQQQEEIERAEAERKNRPKLKKDFALISFGGEAEEEEQELATKFVKKAKSIHDLVQDDPRLRKETSISRQREEEEKADEKEIARQIKELDKKRVEGKKLALQTPEVRILAGDEAERHFVRQPAIVEDGNENDNDDNDDEEDGFDEKMRARLMRKRAGKQQKDDRDEIKRKKVEADQALDPIEKLRLESKRLASEILESRKAKVEEVVPAKREKTEAEKFLEDQKAKYQSREKLSKEMREAQTMKMLARFQTKLKPTSPPQSPTHKDDEADEKVEKADADEEEDPRDLTWMQHALIDVSAKAAKGIDPEKDPYSLELIDPRNPLNVRRRKEQQEKDSKHGKKDNKESHQRNSRESQAAKDERKRDRYNS